MTGFYLKRVAQENNYENMVLLVVVTKILVMVKMNLSNWDFRLTEIKTKILVMIKEDRRIGILG
jgi:hypothetical protein